jgi:phosphoglycerate kinase
MLGSKVSTKLMVLESLLERVDQLIVGGGIANTFLAATGLSVGKSLCETEMLDVARRLMDKARARGTEIPLPTDVVVAREFASTAHADVRPVNEVRPDEMILDIGPDSADRYAALLQSAGTIGWNGPVAGGVDQAARAPVPSPGNRQRRRSGGGGGDVAAIEKYGVEDSSSYVSTAAGRRFLRIRRGQDPACGRHARAAARVAGPVESTAAPHQDRRHGRPGH